MKKKWIVTLLAMLFTITASVFALTSCKDEPKENVSITMTEKEISLTVGESQRMGVKILPEDAMDKNIEWKSSDEEIVTVTDGVVTAKKEGEATVTATTNKKSDSCKVTVKAKKDEVPSEEGNGNSSEAMTEGASKGK